MKPYHTNSTMVLQEGHPSSLGLVISSPILVPTACDETNAAGRRESPCPIPHHQCTPVQIDTASHRVQELGLSSETMLPLRASSVAHCAG